MENENIFRLLDKPDTPIKIKKLLNQFIDDLNSQQSSAWKREVQQDHFINFMLCFNGNRNTCTIGQELT